MNRRALLIAVAFSAIGVLLLMLYVNRFEQEASGGERVRVLTVVKALEPGTVIDESALSVREIPVAYIEDRFVKAVEKAKVAGLKLGTKLETDQILLWTDLAIAADERRDLSGLIQPGNRAVSIAAERSEKSYAMIRPGDYVDVIANLPSKDNPDKRNAIVMLQRILVLAVGLETSVSVDNQAVQEMILTLSVDLESAQLLSLAQEKGTLLVALRNPEDHQIVQRPPQRTSADLDDQQIIAQGTRKAASTAPIKLKGSDER
jgi:pilus assembly protein CpaB